MRRFILLTIIICLFAFVDYMDKRYKLPKILLPKGTHHTIGELPFLEAMDDGDFFEIDGDEEKIFSITTKEGEVLWVRY